jgi:TldD protein
VSTDEKLRLLDAYNRIVLETDPSIESSHVQYSDRFRTVYFASTRGNYFMEERPRVVCAFGAVARAGSLVQHAHDSVASNTTFDVTLGLEGQVREVASRAAALLKAPKCAGGTYSVILNPNMAGVFIHEAFGHLSEADAIYENEQMRQMMFLGREVGPPTLNVADDGSIPGLMGTQLFDDEGTPTGRTWLIRNGVLSGHLHSLETAGKMGARPTGNARAIRRGASPICRMTNTFVDNGTVPVDELFAGVDTGLYACDAFGGQTALEMFTFSAAYGYRIENGRKGELIRDVTLSGNVFRTLQSIDGIGSDFVFVSKGGGCGKGGQSPLPVGLNSPHLRIRNVVVGGQ